MDRVRAYRVYRLGFRGLGVGFRLRFVVCGLGLGFMVKLGHLSCLALSRENHLNPKAQAVTCYPPRCIRTSLRGASEAFTNVSAVMNLS